MRNAAVLLFVAGLAGSASAQLKTWDGDGGNLLWFDGANWDPDGVPEASDRVVLEAGGRVVAESQPVEVVSLEALSGLEIVSSSLTFSGGSRIVGLFTGGCCRPEITHNSTLRVEGSSVLGMAASFRGAGVTTLDGTVLIDEQLYARDSHEVVIAGEMLMTPSGALQPWDTGRIVVEGTVTGAPSAGIGRVVGPAVVVNRGLIRLLEPGLMRFVGSVLTESAGTVLADVGEIELVGNCDFAGGTIEARNGGLVELLMGADSDIRDVTMQGDGEVYVQTGRGVFTGTSTANMSEPGSFVLRNPIQIAGTLRNTGHMTLFGTTLRNSGGGGVLETTGLIDVQVGSTLEVPTTVLSGGTLQPRVAMTVDEPLTTEPGGEVLFRDVGVAFNAGFGSPGKIINGGRVTLDESLDFGGARQMVVINAPVDMEAGGEIRVAGGDLRLRGGGAWRGGSIVMEGAPEAFALVNLEGDGRVWSIDGDVRTTGFGLIDIGKSNSSELLEINGTLTLGTLGFLDTHRLAATLRGPGEVVIESQADASFGGTRGTRIETTLRNRGFLGFSGSGGYVSGTIVNEATVLARGVSLDFDGGLVENSGTWEFSSFSNARYRAVASGMFMNTGVVESTSGSATIDIRFQNDGTVRADGAGITLTDCANIDLGVLTGGTWVVDNEGWISFGDQVITALDGAAVDGDGEEIDWAEGVDEIRAGSRLLARAPFNSRAPAMRLFDGALEVQGGIVRTPGIELDNGSNLSVGDGATIDADGPIELKSVVDDLVGVVELGLLPMPATIVTPLLDVAGRVLPGGEGRAGRFDIVGTVVCGSGAQMVFDVGGTGDTDEIAVTESVVLGGSTLRVSLLDEHEPGEGDSYVLIAAAAGVSGEFGALVLPDLGGELGWEVEYTPTEVVLRVSGGCVADWNGDGSVNTQDFLAYLNDWNVQRLTDCSGGCTADLNGDGTVNTQDFLLFLNTWTGGC